MKKHWMWTPACPPNWTESSRRDSTRPPQFLQSLLSTSVKIHAETTKVLGNDVGRRDEDCYCSYNAFHIWLKSPAIFLLWGKAFWARNFTPVPQIHCTKTTFLCRAMPKISRWLIVFWLTSASYLRTWILVKLGAMKMPRTISVLEASLWVNIVILAGDPYCNSYSSSWPGAFGLDRCQNPGTQIQSGISSQ